jgi:hypothetical protein
MRSARIRALLLSSPVIVLMSIAVLLAFMPAQVSAGVGNLTVYGFIRDTGGMPLEGAEVTVDNLDKSETPLTDTSEPDGLYQVDFNDADWDIGDTIRTTVEHPSYEQESEEEVVTSDNASSGLMQIDVQFSYAIPEFGSFAGVLVASVLMGALAVYKVRKK